MLIIKLQLVLQKPFLKNKLSTLEFFIPEVREANKITLANAFGISPQKVNIILSFASSHKSTVLLGKDNIPITYATARKYNGIHADRLMSKFFIIKTQLRS